MGKLVLEGPDKKLAVIQSRFRSFGVTFTPVTEEAPSADPVKPKKENKPKQPNKPAAPQKGKQQTKKNS